MANIIEITDLNMKELIPYTDTSEKKLIDYFSHGDGIFTAESPKVIRTALDSGYEPISLLIERKYINGQASDIIKRCGEIPVYTASSSILEQFFSGSSILSSSCPVCSSLDT